MPGSAHCQSEQSDAEMLKRCTGLWIFTWTELNGSLLSFSCCEHEEETDTFLPSVGTSFLLSLLYFKKSTQNKKYSEVMKGTETVMSLLKKLFLYWGTWLQCCVYSKIKKTEEVFFEGCKGLKGTGWHHLQCFLFANVLMVIFYHSFCEKILPSPTMWRIENRKWQFVGQTLPLKRKLRAESKLLPYVHNKTWDVQNSWK